MIETLSNFCGRPVSRETFERLELYVDLLREANQGQNLVSPSSIDAVWERHILDAAQLVALEEMDGKSWVDIGSGAGLPGLVVATLVNGQATLIEPRRLRAEFLNSAIDRLGLTGRVKVIASKAERVPGTFEIVTARAVAALPKLLEISTHLSTGKTRWLLPKGRNWQSELADAQRNWQCEVQVVPSRTDPESGILVLSGVRAKGKR
jgi:16S rRNA (guanine527-N7)-methyltransferase